MFKVSDNKILIYLGGIIILLLSLFLLGFIIVKANSPDNPDNPPPGTEIGVCIDPPYPDTSNPRQPIFSWTTSGNSQVGYWLQVDNNSDFSSPEINRNVDSGDHSYQTPTDQLARKTTHWYRIAVRDAYGWTGWTGCNSFYLPGLKPNPPTNLSVSQPDYCASGPAGIFSWTFNDPDPGDSQSAYQVQVYYYGQVFQYTRDGREIGWKTPRCSCDKENDIPDCPFTFPASPSDPDVCYDQFRTFFGRRSYRYNKISNTQTIIADDSGKVNSSSNSYATPQGKLSYNTTYYWRVKTWDTDNFESDWASGPQFTTPRHAYPTIDFSWAPSSPSVQEIVQFADQSTVYGGTTKSSWAWTFQDGNPGSSNQQNPQVKFGSEGSKQITLRVTDSDGFACTGSKTLNISLPLPEWKEIPPF